MDDKRFHCDSCLGQYPGVENREKAIESDRKRKYCWGAEPEDVRGGFTIQGIKFRACPGNFWSNQAASWIRAWWQMQRGLPVCEGPVGEWPAKVFEVFAIIEKLEAEKREKQNKRGTDGGEHGKHRRPSGDRRGK